MSSTRDPRFPNTPAASPGNRPGRRPARRTRAPETPPAGAERLQKVLADSGVASRRDCELKLREARIRVNGAIVRELPCWVRPGKDMIEVDGEIIDTTRRAEVARARLYIAVNKPKGVISTARDPEGRPHVVGLVQAAVPRGERVYPVGRLDADSTGLVLMTDDGDLAHRLTHPRYGISKDYRVTVEGHLDGEVIESLKRGFYIASPDAIARSKGGRGGGGGQRTAIDQLRVLRRQKDRRTGGVALLSITLREGQNREIRRLLARVGLKVRRLERVSIGPLKLGSLKPGAWRPLLPAEVAALRKAALLD